MHTPPPRSRGPAPRLDVLVLVLVPPLVGACMVLVGRWRAKRGEPLLRIDRFVCGTLFAFGFALVRFLLAA